MKGINWILQLIKFYRLVPFFIFLHTFSNAQGSSITGRAYDEADKKFGPVRVVIYDQNKKKIFEQESAGSGKFKIKNIRDGKYIMNVYGEGGRGVTENITIKGSKFFKIPFCEKKINIDDIKNFTINKMK